MGEEFCYISDVGNPREAPPAMRPPVSADRSPAARSPGVSATSGWTEPRVLLRPRPGFYVMRLRRAAPLVPALIYQLCPMVMPQPTALHGPDPEEWCRPLDRSPRYGALIDGTGVAIDAVWTARSLRPVSPEEYAFRIGPLRRWARTHPLMPEGRPEQPVDLAALPPLF